MLLSRFFFKADSSLNKGISYKAPEKSVWGGKEVDMLEMKRELYFIVESHSKQTSPQQTRFGW